MAKGVKYNKQTEKIAMDSLVSFLTRLKVSTPPRQKNKSEVVRPEVTTPKLKILSTNAEIF